MTRISGSGTAFEFGGEFDACYATAATGTITMAIDEVAISNAQSEPRSAAVAPTLPTLTIRHMGDASPPTRPTKNCATIQASGPASRFRSAIEVATLHFRMTIRLHRCPYRKSNPDVLMVQSTEERLGNDPAKCLDLP